MNLKIFAFIFLAFMLLGQNVWAQLLSGTVSDVSGESIPGVNVLIKGTSQGTVTDIDGKYTLEVDPGAVLLFKFLGFKPQEFSVDGKTTLNVVLEEEASFLEEVVVTGYETTTKRSFTGATQSVKLEDMRIEGFPDASRMLEGRAAGVSIQNVSGTFGSAPRVTIRGSSTILGNATPLWVVDGTVQEDITNVSVDDLTSGNASTLISSAIAGLNPNDIASMEILKDASAVSLYGARALNGVIVVTTKKGRKDSPVVVNYTTQLTMRDIPSYVNYDILDSKENMAVLKELEAKGHLGHADVVQGKTGGVYQIMYSKTNMYDDKTGKYVLENTPEARNKFLQTYELVNTDWFKELFRNSVMQNHTLSFTGGGAKNTYFVSLGYYHDPGWTVADKVDRVTANLKNTFMISDKLSVTFSILGSSRKQFVPGTFQRDQDLVRGTSTRDFDLNPFSYALNVSRTLRPRDEQGNLEYYRDNWTPFNIRQELDNNYMELNVNDIRMQTDVGYAFNDHLKYNLTASFRYVTSSEEHNVKDNSNAANAYRSQETTIVRDQNIYLYQDLDHPTRPPVSVLPEGGIYIRRDNTLTNYYIRNSISYKNTFAGIHELDVLMGQEIRYLDRRKSFFAGYGLQYERGYTPFTNQDIMRKIVGQSGDEYFTLSEERERTVGFYGRGTYLYRGKYVLSLAGRMDGSNQQGFSPASRWLPTWTASAKWNTYEEAFMSNVDLISNLQLRLSYGLNATTGPADNSLAIFKSRITRRLSPSDREASIFIEDLENSELTWEKKYEFDVGVDVGLLQDRVQLTADVYWRNASDLIDYVRTSGIGGERIKVANNGDMETIGAELSLSSVNIASENFKWRTSVNLSRFKQKITRLENRPILLDMVDDNGANVVGYPRQSLFSIRFTGLNEEGFPTFDIPDEDKVSGIDFQDLDDPQAYLKYEGPTEPNVSAGLSNTFMYKNWSLTVFISGAAGNKIRLAPLYSNLAANRRFNDAEALSKAYRDRWLLPGDEENTNIPVIPSARQFTEYSNLDRAYTAYNLSTERIADGSFIRMKNVALTYTFPKKWISVLKISRLSCRFMATNLFLIYSDSKLSGQDPEFFRSGGVALPVTRQYTFSVNLSF